MTSIEAASTQTLNWSDAALTRDYRGSTALLDRSGSALDNGINNGDRASFSLPGCRSGTLAPTLSSISNAATYRPGDMQKWFGASVPDNFIETR